MHILNVKFRIIILIDNSIKPLIPDTKFMFTPFHLLRSFHVTPEASMDMHHIRIVRSKKQAMSGRHNVILKQGCRLERQIVA
jgi:hypothetical protein